METFGFSRREAAPLVFVETSRGNRPDEVFFLVSSPSEVGHQLFARALAEYKRGAGIRTPEEYMTFLRDTAFSLDKDRPRPLETPESESPKPDASPHASGSPEFAAGGSEGEAAHETPHYYGRALWYGAAWLRGEVCHWVAGGRFLMASISREGHVLRLSGDSGKTSLEPQEKIVAADRADFDDIEERLRAGGDRPDVRSVLKALSEEKRLSTALVVERQVLASERPGREKQRPHSLRGRVLAERPLVAGRGQGSKEGTGPPAGSATVLARESGAGKTRRRLLWAFSTLAALAVVLVLLRQPWNPESRAPETEEVAVPPEVSPAAIGSEEGVKPPGSAESQASQVGPVSLSVDWTKKYGAPVTSSPRVSDGRVYFGCRDGNLYCLDAETGKEIWKFRAGSGIGASPAVERNRVFVGSYDGTFWCIDAASGKVIWRFRSGGRIVSSATVTGRNVLFGSYDRSLYCLSADDGSQKWKLETGGLVWCSPLVLRDRCYFGSADGTFYCVLVSSGNLKWKRSLGRPIYSTPAGTPSSVCVGTNGRVIHFLDAEDGDELHRVEVGGEVRATLLVEGENAYSGADDGVVRCIRWSDGARTWNFRSGGPVRSAPALYRGVLFVTSYDGRLHALEASSGKEVSSFDARSQIYSSPAVAGDRVYFGTNNGDVFCVKVGRS